MSAVSKNINPAPPKNTAPDKDMPCLYEGGFDRSNPDQIKNKSA